MPSDGRIYKWAKGSTFKAEAQVAGEYIEELRQQNGGYVTPTMVWEAAEDPSSPIHDEFQWNERKAAEAHWRERARNLVNHIIVVRVHQQPAEEGIQAFTSIDFAEGEDEKSARGYISTGDLLSDEEKLEAAIAEAFKRLKAVKTAYGYLTELDDIWSEIRKTEKKRAAYQKKKKI